MIDRIIELLKETREIKARRCSNWKDSGDCGACFAHEVEPIDEMILYLENIPPESLYDVKREEMMERYQGKK